MKMRFVNLLGGLFLLGVFLVGCVSVDEPKGVQDLRSAKAEFLKAQAAVQLAEVKVKEAQASFIAAQAKQEEAIAQGIVLSNEIQKTRDENEKARLEADLKQYQANAQLELLIVQAKTADAQKSYEVAIAQLSIAKSLQIPDMYKQALEEVMNNLTDLMYSINNIESEISYMNLTINYAVTKDSTRTDYMLRERIKLATNELAVAQEQLTIAKSVSTASNAELVQQLTTVNTKIASLTADKNAAQSQLDALNSENSDLQAKIKNYDFPLNQKIYTAEVALPDVSSIRDEINNYYGITFTTKIRIVGNLEFVISHLTDLESKVTNWKNSNPSVTEWNTLLESTTSKLKEYTDTKDKLLAEIQPLQDKFMSNGQEITRLTMQKTSIETNLGYYQGTDPNNLGGLKKEITDRINGNTTSNENLQNNISNLESRVTRYNADLNMAKENLNIFLKEGNTMLRKHYETEIKEYQQQLEVLKVQFDQVTKTKDALLAKINELNK